MVFCPTVRDFTIPAVWQAAIATRLELQCTAATTPVVKLMVTFSFKLLHELISSCPVEAKGTAEAKPDTIKPANKIVIFFMNIIS
ncbi:hypothetical protein HN51_00800 [Ectopseudomonas mendocina]|uniref:Uncharacterized protein n=1 Tax=Ectopseudomonas mendocina S5.2 TaxID=1225174 RepID=A0ABN4IYG9_ECTME|nr:hypothetical protein DW68_019235 [Pseudomonas mendocina S5.2]KER98395.1 hypothetical protein HN51_00800 [Pseudomonas mendocina]